jgi:hypothetical protein
MGRLLYLILLSFGLFLGSCDNQNATDDSFKISGAVRDAVTNGPVMGVQIFACPGTHVGNATINIGEKILKGVTDECGQYSIEIPKTEANYSQHANSEQLPVLLFSSKGYGESVERPGRSREFDLKMRRPFIDTIFWAFDENSTTLRVSVRTNGVALFTYPEEGQYQTIYLPNGNVRISYEVSPGVFESRNFQDVPFGSWITDVMEVDEGQQMRIRVDASGTASSWGEEEFRISESKPVTQTYVYPLAVYPVCP